MLSNGFEFNLNDDVLYNFKNAISQFMRYDGVICWRGQQEKHPLFFQVFDVLSNPKGIVANLIAFTGIKIQLFVL
jgi:hypothetical protein